MGRLEHYFQSRQDYFSSETIHCHDNTLTIQSAHPSISIPQATTIKPAIDHRYPELIANESAINTDAQHLTQLSLAIVTQPTQHTKKPTP